MQSTPHINYFAQTDFRGKKKVFGIKSEDRSKHMYVIGKTGMGKSTMLENMAIQDIKNGEGLAFLDPHGKTAQLLLDYVPEERIKDVIFFAPYDLENPIAFNIMEDVGKDQRHLVSNGLMATFKKIWEDAWSARMEYILTNTILALLEYPGSTLLSVNRMLSDKKFRKKVVDNITDPSVKSFWVDEFANYTDRFAAEATPAIQNKVGQFTSNPLIRNIIGQPKSSFDLRKVMDEKKILIVDLSKGRVGEQNVDLLGGMMVTKIYLAAMSRADKTDAELSQLPPFYLYVDEFQSFVNESFADILSEARKYKLSLTIAHQYIEQMPENVRHAVFGNMGTTVAFRVGPFDAEVLETVFAPVFTQEDLINLGIFQIYMTMMIDGVGSKPFSATTIPPIVNLEDSHREEIIASSQKLFAKPREEVEKNIADEFAEDSQNNNNGNGGNKNAGSRGDGKPPVTANSTYRPKKIADGSTGLSVNAPIGIIGGASTRPTVKTPEKRPAPKPLPENNRLGKDQLGYVRDESKNKNNGGGKDSAHRPKKQEEPQNNKGISLKNLPQKNKKGAPADRSELRSALASLLSDRNNFVGKDDGKKEVKENKPHKAKIKSNEADTASAQDSPPVQAGGELKTADAKGFGESRTASAQGYGESKTADAKGSGELKKEVPEEELRKILNDE